MRGLQPEVTTGAGGETRTLAAAALVLAIVTVFSVTMVGVTSLTSFDPPHWLRVATMAVLPFTFPASIACAVIGLRRAPVSPWAIAAALLLDGLALVAFGVIIAFGG